MQRLRLWVFLFAVSASALAGCAAGGVPSGSLPPGGARAGAVSGSVAYVYVASNGNDTVGKFPYPINFGQTPSPVSTVVSAPIGIAVDNAYVITTDSSGNVNVYDQPFNQSAPTPNQTLTGGAGLATFDGAGNLWVGTASGSVLEYKPPFSSPSAIVTAGLTDAYGVAFDAAGNLYVSNGDASRNVLSYQPPYSGTPIAVSPPGAGTISGVTVYNNTLFVGSSASGGSTKNQVYAYGLPLGQNSTPQFTIDFGTCAVGGLAVDGSENLYVTCPNLNQLWIDEAVAGTPSVNGSDPNNTLMLGGLNRPIGIALGN